MNDKAMPGPGDIRCSWSPENAMPEPEPYDIDTDEDGYDVVFDKIYDDCKRLCILPSMVINLWEEYKLSRSSDTLIDNVRAITNRYAVAIMHNVCPECGSELKPNGQCSNKARHL